MRRTGLKCAFESPDSCAKTGICLSRLACGFKSHQILLPGIVIRGVWKACRAAALHGGISRLPGDESMVVVEPAPNAGNHEFLVVVTLDSLQPLLHRVDRGRLSTADQVEGFRQLSKQD